MFLIPYRTWHIGSSAAPSTLAACLRGATDFVGVVGDDSFRLVPASTGRNTYLPRLRDSAQVAGHHARLYRITEASIAGRVTVRRRGRIIISALA